MFCVLYFPADLLNVNLHCKIAMLLSKCTMFSVLSFSYVAFMIQEEEIHSSLDLANTTKSLPVFFSPVLFLCSTLEGKCMYKCVQLVGSL